MGSESGPPAKLLLFASSEIESANDTNKIATISAKLINLKLREEMLEMTGTFVKQQSVDFFFYFSSFLLLRRKEKQSSY